MPWSSLTSTASFVLLVLLGAGVVQAHGIDVAAVWRSDGAVFSDEQLARIEPILKNARCKDVKVGCAYSNAGRLVKAKDADIRLIPWKVSAHPAYLVRADRCGAGGCDEGLFVRIDGRWRLLIESFGRLERQATERRGFADLVFRPRGGEPVVLGWDGRAYRPDEGR
ncbi:MAG TPA: hypothetical protein VEA38_15830 [Terriglobales bacterium]|nr:hypothetical protein [Terriglobales bacterium]